MIIIGADGGGTKTALSAFREDTEIARARSGPMNYNFIGVNAAADNLISGIRALGIPDRDIAAIGIGDPSLDDGLPDDGDCPALRFAARIRQEFHAPVFIRSDAYITLFGLTGGTEPAVLMLSGTGSMGIAENAQGEIRVVGGWGRITGDEGSGYYIAVESIRAALRAADGIAPQTLLTDAALRHFGARTPRDLIRVFYGEPEPDIAAFAEAAADCALRGDETARRILLQTADYLAACTTSLLHWSQSRRLGIYGSVICRNPIVRDAYETQLRARHPGLTLSEPPVAAEQAAARYALKMLQAAPVQRSSII